MFYVCYIRDSNPKSLDYKTNALPLSQYNNIYINSLYD